MYMTVKQFLVVVQWLAESAHERGRGFDSWIFLENFHKAKANEAF